MNTATADFTSTIMPLESDLRRRALGLTRSPDAADDLVQDTLARAWRGWRSFQPGTNPAAWAMTIMRNTFITDYHKRSRMAEAEARISAAAVEDPSPAIAHSTSTPQAPDAALETRRGMARIEAALASIQSDDYRKAVVLADVEGRSYSEIAAIMGCPIGTVMSRLHRGRAQLRASLRDDAVDLGIPVD